MIVERSFTTKIDTKDPKFIYSPDIREAFKSLLNERFKNKCYKNCLIIEVIDILRHSPLICCAQRVGGMVEASVEFLAKCTIFDKFEVIPEARLVEIARNNIFVFKSNNASIKIRNSPLLAKYKVGDNVPLRAMDIKYHPGQTEIIIAGVPYIPLDFDSSHVISISKSYDVEISSMMDTVNELNKKFNALATSKKWRIIIDPKTPVIPKEYKKTKIDDIKEGNYELYRKEWNVLGEMYVWIKPTDEKINQPAETINLLKTFLNTAIKELEAIISINDIYSPTDKLAWIDVYKKESG